MKKLKYEKLREEHLPYVYDIRFSVIENIPHPHQIQYLLRDKAIEDINQGGGWICSHGDNYVGYAFGVFIPDPIVGGLFVRPTYQKMGIGTFLLRHVTDWLFWEGAVTITLTTDAGSRAESFYINNGWKVCKLDDFGQLELKKCVIS